MDAVDAATLSLVPLDRIEVPRERMRRDLGDLDTLAQSLHEHGQLAPVVVYPVSDGRLRLIAGERRLEATRRLHAARVAAGEVAPESVPSISVLVRALDPGQDPAEIELAENEQRRELTAEEEADAFIQLVRGAGREMQDVAGIAGRSVAYVSKRVRVFEDATLRKAIVSGHIAISQAEELLVVPAAERESVLQQCLVEGWTNAQLRDAVQGLGTPDGAVDGSEESVAAAVHRNGSAAGARGHRASLRDPGVRIERPRDLTRRIRELNDTLSDLRPFQLTPRDDRALRALWGTLRFLARAPRERLAPTLPSLADAEAISRRRS